MPDDSLGGTYLLRKYGPGGVPSEPMPGEVYLETGGPPPQPGVGASMTATPTATEPLASGIPGAPLEQQPPFTLQTGAVPVGTGVPASTQIVPSGFRGTEIRPVTIGGDVLTQGMQWRPVYPPPAPMPEIPENLGLGTLSDGLLTNAARMLPEGDIKYVAVKVAGTLDWLLSTLNIPLPENQATTGPLDALAVGNVPLIPYQLATGALLSQVGQAYANTLAEAGVPSEQIAPLQNKLLHGYEVIGSLIGGGPGTGIPAGGLANAQTIAEIGHGVITAASALKAAGKSVTQAKQIVADAVSGKLHAPLLTEEGKAHKDALLVVSRAIAGATAGSFVGDTWEERAKNALIGLGVGAAASPALVKRIAQVAREGSAEYRARVLQQSLEGRDPLGPVTAAESRSVRTIPATDVERSAFLQSIGDALPSGGDVPGGIPPALVQVNWATLRDPAAVDSAIDAIAKMRPVPTEVIPQDVSRAAARELGLTTQQMLQMEQAAGGETAKIQAMKDLVVAARNKAMAMANQLDAMVEYAPGYQELDLAFREHLGLFAALTQKLLGRASEMGRAFNMLKSLPQEVGDTAAIAAMAGKDLAAIPTEMLVAHVKTLPPTSQVSYFTKLMEAGELMVQTANWAWMNARLATIEGGAANTLTNLAMVSESPLLRMIAAPMGSVREIVTRAAGRSGEIDRIYWGESFAQVLGAARSVPEALVAAWDVIKGNESVFGGIAKESPHFRPTGEYLGVRTDSPMGAAIRLVTSIAELPNRVLLMAPDEFAKVLNYRGEIYAQAYNMVEREFGGQWFAPLRSGLESTQTVKRAGVASDGEILTRAVTARERFLDIIRDPESALKQMATGKTESVSDLAKAEANLRTFNAPLTGRMGQLAEALSHPLARMTFVPFFKVPVQIGTTALEHAGLQFLPVIGQLAAHAQQNVRMGGAARDLELAKLTVGGALLWWGAEMGLTGEIHGGGSTDPDLLELEKYAGLQPYSWIVGDKVYGINRFDVFGQLLTAAADYVQLRPHMRDDEAESIAAALTLTVSRNVLSKTYLEGAAQALKFMMEKRPESLGKNPILRNLVRSIVPSGVAQVERFMDPALRDVYTMMDEIKSRVPGLSKTLKPRLNWLTGEPQVAPPGWSPDWLPGFVSIFSPIKVTELNKDPVIAALLEDQTSIGRPPGYIDGSNPDAMRPPDPRQGIPLNDEQRYQYARLSAKLEIDGKIQHEALQDVLDMPGLTPGPTGTRRDAMSKVVSAYRKQAKAELLHRFPELRQKFVEKMNALSVAKSGEAGRMTAEEQQRLLEDLTR